ncbi:MAG TPA: DUF222 domain-containing protein, partial [Streptosporangiaceae bacterium]|nr:DUF222 domain-containing protein [Streptosporangiaceae bacterium]
MPAAPATTAQAVAMAKTALNWLATADVASLPTALQAECLRGLEQTASMHTAARSRVLSAFNAQSGFEDDGQGSARTWLKWQTRVTGGAAYGAMAWMRRLAGHPAVGDALAAGEVSESWAREICDWTDKLPGDVRGDADVLLLGAAAGGLELRDLGKLAEEIQRQCTLPDTDGDDDFMGRSVRLDTTFEGAGKLDGNLTPQCAAALQAVLDALGKRRGPEDERTKAQRLHDALEDACRRLVASGCLPDRAAQPTQIVLHMDLDRLRGLPGAPEAEAAWAGQATAGPGYDCDAQIVPVVTGRVDPGVLDRLAAMLLHGTPAGPAQPGISDIPAAFAPATPGQPGDGDATRRARSERAARRMIVKAAADLLSGPGGLAAYLRTRLAPDTVASVSLPLDVGTATETIPVQLRRAVAVRDRGCRFPGCDQPVAACQPHHIIPR